MRNLSFITIVCAIFFSCEVPECRNTNPIFDRYAPDSQEYMRELKKQLNTNMSEGKIYSVEGYLEKDRKEFMRLRVQDSRLCATMILDITGNEKLENFRRTKGQSYYGAMIQGLGYLIEEENGTLTFKLTKIENIFD